MIAGEAPLKHLRNILAVLASAALIAAFWFVCVSNNRVLTGMDASGYSLTFDNGAWHYDAEHDVYWQTGVVSCSKPAAVQYESFGIYVPGSYMLSRDNGDGTYTCSIRRRGRCNGFTTTTAPIVMPLSATSYAAQPAPTTYDYQGVASYMDAGYVCILAGYRGSNNGYDSQGNLTYSGSAPWGVVDLKAVVSYLRYNAGILPGSTDHIYTCGQNGGGTLAAVLGASGDSSLYYDYLDSIGAVMSDVNGKYISDAIEGVMCWSPVVGLDYADEAYEWLIGQYLDSGARADGTFTKALSDDLAEAYAKYLSRLRLRDSYGYLLQLSQSDDDIYTLGRYYEHVKLLIEGSLDDFLATTTFPCVVQDKVTSRQVACSSAQDYVDYLNSTGSWVSYDPSTNTATITDIQSFVQHRVVGARGIPAYDRFNRDGAENLLFGNDDADALHFDTTLSELLQKNQERYASYADWNPAFATAFVNDVKQKDALGTELQVRQNMYNPLYYLKVFYGANGTALTASRWSIESDITDGNALFLDEMNLALALHACGDVRSLDYATPWEPGQATTDHTDAFVSWVRTCCTQ